MPKFFESVRKEVLTIDDEVSTIAQDINSLSNAVATVDNQVSVLLADNNVLSTAIGAISTPVSSITKGASLAIATAGLASAAAVQTIDDQLSTALQNQNSLSSAIATVDNEISTMAEVIRKGTGTEIASNKSLVDAMGVNGTSTINHDYGEGSLSQFLHGMYNEAVILFVVPEAADSLNAHNAAILAELQKTGEVLTITQADALTYPDFESITMCVLGTDNGGTLWTLSNLADIKIIPNLPLLSCDASTGAYFEIGTDGGDAAAKTVINAIANIGGSILGTGFHADTGLSVGANTVSSSTIYNTLDMSNANLTETWYAYESVNANTDVVLAEVRRIQPDGSLGIDETGAEVPATMAFYGCAFSFNDLNALGKTVFRLLCEKLIFGVTIGSSLTIAGDIGDLETKTFGNMSNRHTNAVPLAAFISGNSGGTGTELPNSKSLYDVQKDLSTAIVTIDNEVSTLTDNVQVIDNEVSTLNDKVDTLSTAIQRKPVSRDWWSVITPVATITGTSTAKALPEVTIPGSGGNRLPAGATIQGAIAMVKFRKIKNTHATKTNALSHVQHLQVRDDGGGGWHNALTLPAGLLDIATATIEGGDLWIGSIDLSSTGYVDAADTYEFRIDEAHAEQTNLELRGIQSGIRVYYY